MGLVVLFWDQITPGNTDQTEGSITSILFVEDVFDFGNIAQGKKVEHAFRFKNTGNVAYTISKVNADNGFSVVSHPQEPVPALGVGEVVVAFNSENRSGRQEGKITISGNTSPAATVITTKAFVKPEPPSSPVARFTVDKDNCRAPCSIRFSNESRNATSYKWSFGDGQTNRSKSPTHRYTEEGVYTVQLRATSADGINDFTKRKITVTKAPSTSTPEETVVTSWGWKRATQSNIDDIHKFLNGTGTYSRAISNAEITPGVGSRADLIVFYQSGGRGGWGWKRVSNANLEDATNFLSGKGSYSRKIKKAEIVPSNKVHAPTSLYSTNLVVIRVGAGSGYQV